MKWIADTNSQTTSRFYLLADAKLAEIKINQHNRTVRVELPEKRLFFFEPAGKFQQKIIFRNEYGQSMGSLSSKDGEQGTIDLLDDVFHFHQDDDLLHLEGRDGSYYHTDRMVEKDLQSVSVILFVHAWLLHKGKLQEGWPLKQAVGF